MILMRVSDPSTFLPGWGEHLQVCQERSNAISNWCYSSWFSWYCPGEKCDWEQDFAYTEGPWYAFLLVAGSCWIFNDKIITEFYPVVLLGLAPEIPEDLYHLIKKAVSIRKHLERNRKDKDSKFRLILVESRIHRLARYYKKTKKLPPVWK